MRIPSLRLIVSIVAVTAACGPRLPSTQVPPPASPTLEPFRAALQNYVERTQPFRKEAAQAAEQVPANATPLPRQGNQGAEAAVRTRTNALAEALKHKVRPNARQGELIVPAAAELIRQDIRSAFDSPRRALLMDALAEQNDTGKAGAKRVTLNERVDAPRVPPLLVEVLPALPAQLEYDFAGRTLILRDVDADIVVDYLNDALPAPAPTEKVAAVQPTRRLGSSSVIGMPGLRGGTVFAAFGDMGSGDIPQGLVAKAMLDYFTNVSRFKFVLMLGDNLYGDDYEQEFSVPYEPLLDRGVRFYAALGNHDRESEIHFKPFNMGDRFYYSFDQGNARFVALNSNRPSEPEQHKWFDGAYGTAGDKWRIAFFHHPLYSSGSHAAEARDVIRPALEPALVRNRVDVVFVGHEHLYERIAPQKGVRYFVSGGGGRKLYSFKKSSFDEVGVSIHHFMVVEIAGDRLFFEAVTTDQRLLDCGVLWRAGKQPPQVDQETATWSVTCEAAMGPQRVPTAVATQ